MFTWKSGRAGRVWLLLLPLILLTLVLALTSRSAAVADTSEYWPPTEVGELAPLRVGEHVTADVSLSYTDPSSWQQTIHHPEAAFIKVRFDKVDLRPGDLIVVSSPDGQQRHTYPGTGWTTDEDPGFWALTIVGEAALVELVEGIAPAEVLDSPLYELALAGADPDELGVHVNKYARGFTDFEIGMEIGLEESTCGVNERTDVACFEESHPQEFDNATAVVRILKNGASHCTGWRVTPDNLLMTNEHCITSQAELAQMEFWFMYQRPGCQTGTAVPAAIVTGNTFLLDNNTLDFALLTLNDFNTIQDYGYLQLDPRTPVLFEEIYLPQHGAGNPKEFGITSDFDPPDMLCRIDDAVRNGYGTNTDTGYYCDTIGGSSGSPVLARDTHMAVAIHHFGVSGTCGGNVMNAGVRIDLIYPLINPYMADQWLGPDATHLVALVGQPVTHTFTIINTGGAPVTYDLSLSGNSWTTNLVTTTPLVVPAEDRATVVVQVTAGANGADTFTLTAAPVTEGGSLVSTGRTSVEVTFFDYLPTVLRP